MIVEQDDLICKAPFRISEWEYQCQLPVGHEGEHKHSTVRLVPPEERGIAYTITWIRSR